MKKFFSVFAAMFVALFVVNFLPGSAKAQRFGLNRSNSDVEQIKKLSLQYLRSRTAHRAVGNADELKVKEVLVDEQQIAHTRIRQTVNEIPVWGGEAIVHTKADATLFAITDDLKEGIAVNTQPNFSEKYAIFIAKRNYSGSQFLTAPPIADLTI